MLVMLLEQQLAQALSRNDETAINQRLRELVAADDRLFILEASVGTVRVAS